MSPNAHRIVAVNGVRGNSNEITEAATPHSTAQTRVVKCLPNRSVLKFRPYFHVLPVQRDKEMLEISGQEHVLPCMFMS